MARQITWNGTSDEAMALLHALSAHCECRVIAGRTVAACASHRMLTRDQRAVDGLLFMRRMAARLLAEEFELGASTTSIAPTLTSTYEPGRDNRISTFGEPDSSPR